MQGTSSRTCLGCWVRSWGMGGGARVAGDRRVGLAVHCLGFPHSALGSRLSRMLQYEQHDGSIHSELATSG